MTHTTFFRLLRSDDKAAALAGAVDALHHGERADGITYQADPHSFHQVPGSPFAYWVSEALRRKFAELPPFEGNGREVRLGDHPSDDFRYLRLLWDVPVGRSRLDWRAYQKGGEFSAYYCDIHLVVDWDASRQTYRGFYGRPGRPNERPSNHQYFFRPGLTWPRRTTSGISVRPLPAGCIFADKGPTAFAPPQDLWSLLALMNSRAFSALLALQLAAAEAAARSYEVGIIQQTPLPPFDSVGGERLGYLAASSTEARRAPDTAMETSHAFTLPALLQVCGASLAERLSSWQQRMSQLQAELAQHQREIDEIAYRLYGISDDDRRAIEESLSRGVAEATDQAESEDEEAEEETAAPSPDRRALAADLLSYALGCAFGRWDVRLALDRSLVPKLQGPFDPLPVCSPGMLIGPDGLPATPVRIVSEEWLRARPDAITLPPEGSVDQPTLSDADYPLRIAWDGILVDDPEHPSDLVRRVREVLALLWPGGDGGEAEAIEREACELLGAPNLHEYFRRPSSFFHEHLKRYSKSRRQAPIYWPLSTVSGSYTLWLYYHRLTSDTLFTAVNRYVEPKLAGTERRLGELTGRLAGASGREARALREEVEVVTRFRDELRAFREELLRVAQLPYRPNLDDGVIINAAPLHALFRNREWAKATRECWQKLQRGDYDWAHLAYTLWPERVEQQCRADKSLAIAHDREDLYREPDAAPTRRGRSAAGR